MDITLIKPIYRDKDVKIRAVISRANASNVKALDYELLGDMITSTKKSLGVMEFKAWQNSILNAVKHNMLFKFHYLNSDDCYDDLCFVFKIDDINVLLYIRDNDSKHIKLLANNLHLSMPAVYKLINRVTNQYVDKLETILGYGLLAKVLK